jgi:short-subunit dehydrogenase
MENRGSDLDVVLVEPGVIDTGFNTRARQALEKYIPESRYSEIYREKLENNESEGAEPREVAKVIVKALESENPKPRYRVTTEAWLAPLLQRIIPVKLQDILLRKFIH